MGGRRCYFRQKPDNIDLDFDMFRHFHIHCETQCSIENQNEKTHIIAAYTISRNSQSDS